LAHANLFQFISHHSTDSVRDLVLLYCNKMLRLVGIMVVIGTRSVFLMSVVLVQAWPTSGSWAACSSLSGFMRILRK